MVFIDGIVVYNIDPLNAGRVKIYVPGIYPVQFKNRHQLLPWAQPAMSLFCGGWKNQLNPAVSKANSIDERNIDVNNNYQFSQQYDETIYTNGSAVISGYSVTSDPTINYNPIEIGNRVLSGQYVSDVIKEIKGYGPSSEWSGGHGYGNGIGGGPNTIHQLNSQTGWCSMPQAGYAAVDGSQVFVFFQAFDINKPVYFAVAQSGAGWFSEHHNQHVFMSNNIRLRVDQDTKRPQSSVKFNTYNRNCVGRITQPQQDWQSQEFQQSPNYVYDQISAVHTSVNYRTKCDMEIYAADDQQIAIDLKVVGKVNIKVVGDVYLQHIGNKYETHIGNYFLHHIGNKYIQHQGNTSYAISGNTVCNYAGNIQKTHIGNKRFHHTGDIRYFQTGELNQHIFVDTTILNSVKSQNITNNIINSENITTTITNNKDISTTITNNSAFSLDLTNKNAISINVTDSSSIEYVFSAKTYNITVKASSVTDKISASSVDKIIDAPTWNITSKIIEWALSKLNFK